MKTFEVTATVKGQEVKTIVSAIDSVAATFKAREVLGYEMKGEFFPLHWSVINGCKMVKN